MMHLTPLPSKRTRRIQAYLFFVCVTLCLVVIGLMMTASRVSSAGANGPGQNPVKVMQPTDTARPQTPIKLNTHTTILALDDLTEYWLDDDTTTPITAVVDRASAGLDLFLRSSDRQVHQSQGKILWIRFEAHTLDSSTRWFLELNSPLIDDAQLFWQDAKGQWMVLKAGDVVPRNLWPLPTRLPTFALQSTGVEPVQYYLRLQNARFPISLPLTIYRESNWLAQTQTANIMHGAMLGLFILVLSTSILMALALRDTAFASFVLYLITLGMFVLSNSGLTPQYLWPSSPLLADRMNYTLACLLAALGPWLVRLILQPAVRQIATDRTIVAVAVFMLALMAVELFAPSQLSYRLLNIGTLTAVALIYTLVVATWRRTDSMARLIAMCFAPVALSILPLIFRNLGWMSNNWSTHYGVQIAACIEMPLLLYALTMRSTRKREGIARAIGLPTHDALTGLPNMRIFLEQMHGSITRAHRFKQSYGLILVDLKNHAWFAKEHGEEIADRATVLCATRLQQLIREVDGICRIDESQFAIAIEGPCSAVYLTKMCARIGAAAHQHTDILPVGANLKLITTCALMPTLDAQQAGDDANAQLGWLISAAESLPHENHKTVRTIGF
jgi:two-component system, sensor histidine kinase LadS